MSVCNARLSPNLSLAELLNVTSLVNVLKFSKVFIWSNLTSPTVTTPVAPLTLNTAPVGVANKVKSAIVPAVPPLCM